MKSFGDMPPEQYYRMLQHTDREAFREHVRALHTVCREETALLRATLNACGFVLFVAALVIWWCVS